MHDERIDMSNEATLAKLLEGWLDGGLADDAQSDLLRQLEEDADLRHRFAEQVAVIGATRAAADANPRWLALFDLLEDEHAREAGGHAFEVVTMGRIKSATSPRWRVGPVAWGLAAALALLVGGGFFLTTKKHPPVAVIVPETTEPPSVEIAHVAVVVGGSAEVDITVGSYLKPGPIAQSTGWLTLQTLKGVSVTLDAPFEAVLTNHDRIRLKTGRARVRVPDGAQGFKLESPAFDVVDLGTEFAAKVNADGTGTCRVFDGEADVSLLDSIGEVKSTQRLQASQSVRITPSIQALQLIDEMDEDYPELKLPQRSKLRLDASYAANVMRMAPVGYWRFEGVSDGALPNEVSNGSRMLALGTATITAEEAGNHSGELAQLKQCEYFKITNARKLLQGDFSICLFAQFDWLQNFALISAMRYDDEIKGHSFILQTYAAFRRTSQNGTTLHAVFRDPPGWDGGIEVHGNSGLRPLRWHHMAITRGDGVVTLYLDGEVIAREFVGDMPMDIREIFIGRLNGNPSQPRMVARGLVGRIDELAVFPRQLTQDEIRPLALPASGTK